MAYEQRYEYIIAQLRNYASGARRNDVYARMRTIAAKLTSEEIDGVARYYASGLRERSVLRNERRLRLICLSRSLIRRGGRLERSRSLRLDL